jgi:hypothetical protein
MAKQTVTKADAPFLRVTVALGGERYEEDLAAQAAITNDIAGLNDALAQHPGRYAWWAMLEVLATEAAGDLERALKAVEGAAHQRFELERSPDGKALTVGAIAARIATDAACRAAADALARAETDLQRLTVGRKTMTEKREALVEMARTMRGEMDAGMLQARSRMEQGLRRPGSA